MNLKRKNHPDSFQVVGVLSQWVKNLIFKIGINIFLIISDLTQYLICRNHGESHSKSVNFNFEKKTSIDKNDYLILLQVYNIIQ